MLIICAINTLFSIPVFRDRMLASALNFAIGFFGYPFEGQYQQSITIEAKGVSPAFLTPFPVSQPLHKLV